MLNGSGKLGRVSSTNVCRRDGDVLLGTNTLEDKLHTGVSLLLETKLTSILSLCMLKVWVVHKNLHSLFLMSSKNALPHSTIACNV